jgi:tRNA(fMet)-specific endonuclease VapC
MVLLDSDTLTHLYADHPRVLQNMKACTDPDIGTTIVSRIEILRGRFEFLLKADTTEQFLRAQWFLFDSEQRLNNMLLAPLDKQSLHQFQMLRQVKGLKKIRRTDMLIASVALSNDATLVTRNLKDFKLVPRLKLANWVD